MRRHRWIHVSVLIGVGLAALSLSGARACALPQKLVQLAWFYRPPSDGNLAPLARYFDTFILTKQDSEVRNTLRTLGITSPFLQYVRFDAIHAPCRDACPCERRPYRNQVAWEKGDYCRIKKRYPDWFLRDRDGKEIAIDHGTERYVWMDPGHPGWQAFWLARVRQSQERFGWDGVFIDNVEASLAKYTKHKVQPRRYSNAAGLHDAVISFLRYSYTTYFHPQHRPMLANIIALREPSVWFRYLRYLDGAMEEAFAVTWHTGYRRTTVWAEHLRRAEQTQKLGKRLILVAQGAEPHDLDRQQFAFASYLLVAHGLASFRYAHSRAYNQVWLYDNYTQDLGQPLGPRYRDRVRWRRDFACGSVWVDPVAHTAGIVGNRATDSKPGRACHQ